MVYVVVDDGWFWFMLISGWVVEEVCNCFVVEDL